MAWLIPPITKKAKLGEAASQADSSKGGGAGRMQKPPQVPTHLIDYEDLLIEVATVSYVYQVPYLKDNPDFADVNDSKCYRAATAWDEGEPVSKARQPGREARSFLAS